MDTVHAIYENGVFRPVEPISLPENSEVEFEPRMVEAPKPEFDAKLDKIYEILGRRHQSGHHDTAERHNEHQP
ncbi:antitoxin family protein [Adhaeretor mobilis]|uniref:DUF104 domain-containing protein n=1 Tax=Adhaeretor mobilis TaxID=1930276 RepID=A0A517MPN5_9BACT|nr:antitoxin family protein [Adhaeretor mobilis]QDS96747.1 hypothetical protein HG15A2_00050 [Adhaeretor mobilis]